MIMFVEGIDARGTEGRSFAARLKRELSPLLDFWHCGEHKYNLGLNDTVEAVPAMKNYYLPHLRMAYSEFKRSSKNRSTFKDLLDWLKERYPNINWKLFLPVLFNLTRWLGLYYCAEMMSKTVRPCPSRRIPSKTSRSRHGPPTIRSTQVPPSS